MNRVYDEDAIYSKVDADAQAAPYLNRIASFARQHPPESVNVVTSGMFVLITELSLEVARALSELIRDDCMRGQLFDVLADATLRQLERAKGGQL